jgi:hypothetical protein
MDAAALRLIKDVAKWKWHPGIYGFVNDFAIPNQKHLTRAELVANGLFEPTSQPERAARIAWLTERLEVKATTGLSAQARCECSPS